MGVKDLQVLGPFLLHRNARLLTLAGRPVRLPPGAVEFLMALLLEPGSELQAQAAESRLRARFPQLRFDLLALAEAINTVLADAGAPHCVVQLDETVFSFQGPVADGGAVPGTAPEPVHGQLPSAPSHWIARPGLLARGIERLQRSNLVTLIGPGGVGKTTTALMMAQACQADFADGVSFVDLAPVRQGGVVGQAVLMALGAQPLQLGQALDQALAQALWDKQLLLVIDNCEHLVEEAATVAEFALRAPRVRVLATSREPLKTFGETLVPVGPMELPPADASPDLETALRYVAVELFLARAPLRAAAGPELQQALGIVYEICRRLDGIALALELAAAHVPSLGLAGLKQRLALWPVESLGSEQSTARHRTLEAALDWSHNLLSEAEKQALRRLSVFRGEFPFESAIALITLGQADDAAAIEGLIGLQGKSLLQVRSQDEAVRYRLLETTRDYALERLREAGEEAAVRRQHAVDCSQRLRAAEREWSGMNGRVWTTRHGRLIDDVRHAVAWGLGASGDVSAATELVIQSLPLTGRLALFDEAYAWLEQALAAVCQVQGQAYRRQELQLLVSFRGMAAHTKRSFAELPGSEARILELVEIAGDDRDAAGACMSVWFSTMNRAHYASAAAASERFIAIAERTGSTVDQVEAYKVAAYAFHFLGRQQQAHDYAMRVLALAPDNVAANYYLVVGCDARVSVRIVEARALWLFGRFEQAAEVARAAYRMALEDRPLAVCLVLSYVTCPMALWNGEFEQAEEAVRGLQDWSSRHGLKPHQDWARWYELILRHRCALAAAQVPADLEPPDAMQADMFATLGCPWLLERTAERVAAGHMGWSAPEVFRRLGDEQRLQGRIPAARDRYAQALAAARAAQATGWELRAAISLAELEADEGQLVRAAEVLAPFRDRVDLGYATADTRRANALLQAWAVPASPRSSTGSALS